MKLFQRDLSLGCQGGDVEFLQQLLQLLGQNGSGRITPHGLFDEPTETGLRSLQFGLDGLSVTGVLCQKTREKLKAQKGVDLDAVHCIDDPMPSTPLSHALAS